MADKSKIEFVDGDTQDIAGCLVVFTVKWPTE
jgi:hypothetical protein